MAQTKTFELRKPLSWGKGDDEKTITSITVREARAGDYEKAEREAGVYGMDIVLIAIVGNTPVDVVDQLFETEVNDIADWITGPGAELMTQIGASESELVLDLETPVKLADGDDGPLTATSLTLFEPTNKQRRQARQAGGPFAMNVALISAIAKVPKTTVRALSNRDFLTACAYLNNFQLRRSPRSDD